jgi:hypothetical protein
MSMLLEVSDQLPAPTALSLGLGIYWIWSWVSRRTCVTLVPLSSSPQLGRSIDCVVIIVIIIDWSGLPLLLLLLLVLFVGYFTTLWVTQAVWRWRIGRLTNNALGTMCKEAIAFYFYFLSKNLHGGIEENLGKDSWSSVYIPSRDLQNSK